MAESVDTFAILSKLEMTGPLRLRLLARGIKPESRASNLLTDQVNNDWDLGPPFSSVGNAECPAEIFKHLSLTPKSMN